MLALIELGKGYPAIGVNEGLLVNPAYAFDIADVIGILGTEVARVFRFHLTKGFPLFFFALHIHNLGFGEDNSFLGYTG